MNLKTKIEEVPSVTPKLARSLKLLGIKTARDLLLYFPRRYLDFSKFTDIRNLAAGEVVTLKVKVVTIKSKLIWKTKRNMAEAIVSDGTGKVRVAWFNQGYIANALKIGDEIFLSGKVDMYKELQLTNPIYEKVAEDQLHTGRLVPVYKLPESVYAKTFRSLVHDCLELADAFQDDIPDEDMAKYRLPRMHEVVRELHFPDTPEGVAKCQERLAFEEALVEQLAVQKHKEHLRSFAAPSISPDVENLKKELAKLPFELTSDQKKALWDICRDLENKHPMNRLLMGDVGSGKTIVAFLAALQVIDKGFQVTLLAPTEVLAKQHFDNIISSPLAKLFQPALLTSSFHNFKKNEVTKKELVRAIENGDTKFVVGTHAILEDNVNFQNLAFVIIDEQHRFGVKQRAKLLDLANEVDGKTSWVPHLLSMTATPIPRTAALALYGDLEVSTITEKPKDRVPIKTWVVPEKKRSGAYEFIKKELVQGRQAFIVTPLVEESEKLQLKSVKAEFEKLRKSTFATFHLGLLYGSMKGADKDAVMQDFRDKKIHVLVSTSVIEIGIDFPNATVIVIEGAEKFGLAQLHQLRGRVGRGAHESYCLLFPSAEGKAMERLEYFAKTTDGFALAEYDLNSRGFGSMFGTDQTGFDFKYGQYITLKVLQNARESAVRIFSSDPELKKLPVLRKLAFPKSEGIHLE